MRDALVKEISVVPSKVAVVALFFGALWGVAGCSVAKRNYVALPVICGVFEPITHSEEDSKETRDQILVYNRVWDQYCRKEKK